MRPRMLSLIGKISVLTVLAVSLIAVIVGGDGGAAMAGALVGAWSP